MLWKDSSRTFLSFAFLTLILSSATSLVLGLQQYNTSISSHGGIDYSTTDVIFKDDFRGALSNWIIESGAWTIENGKLHGTASDNQRIMILYGGEVGKGYEINVKVYVISAMKFPEGQIAFRYDSTGNYYFAGIGAYGYKAAIGNFIDGKASLIAYGGGLEAAKTGVWYDLKVEVSASTLTVYVDGTKFCSVVDTTHKTGKVGLTVYSSSVYYDDVEITRLSPAEPTQPTPTSISRLHVEGAQIKDQFGRRVYLKGVNFDTAEFWGRPYGTEQQFIYMKNWGCNVVRIVIECWAIEGGVMNNPSFLQRLDNMISWAEKHEMYVVLDGWHLSGSTPSGIYRHNTAKYMVDKWDAWITQWRTLATRYKGRIHILYDLINEPLQLGTYANYQRKIRQCIDTIRSIDPEVICIVEECSIGDWPTSFDFEQNAPINRDNVLFSGHIYQWFTSSNTKEAIRSRMSQAKWDWMLRNGRAIWVGEFGPQEAGMDVNSPTWLRNFMNVCNEDGYNGYSAWRWGTRTETSMPLLADWNGNPSDYGKIIQEFL